MSSYTNILRAVKRAAVDAVEAGKPAGIYYGTVAKETPLEITVEQKLTLKAAQLVLCRQVTDYSVTMTVDATTKTYRILNRLKAGEKVALLRMQGGQQYLVLDRVVSA